ncbi:hypothetical protein ACIHFE_21065 [Streptomyces sp. NPDC052396]|uniref:hypothetical protein n=1 Tax=Streptomyces sp. NPDC052396 TaxID=3365689 RepID=UPI0037D1BCF6
MESFDRAFPGFGGEIHGVTVDPATGDYRIECVRDALRGARGGCVMWLRRVGATAAQPPALDNGAPGNGAAQGPSATA